MRKITITDICALTGLSRSTVDRALNERGQVHPRTHATIRKAIDLLNDGPRAQPKHPATPVDLMLRLDQGMIALMRRTFERISGPEDRFFDQCQMNEETVLRDLRMVCGARDRALVVAAKDTPRIRAVLSKARRAGKRIVALISELEADARDAYVGIDNRAAGATAASLLTQIVGDRPASVGVVVGDSAFLCHEDREIGFRTTLREIGRRVVLAAEARGEDNSERTYFAVKRMLDAQPGIGGIYNVSGGNPGLVRALAELGLERDIVVVSHELTEVSVPLLFNSGLNFQLSQDPVRLLGEALDLARRPILQGDTRRHIDFGIYTHHNLPEYARGL